MFESPEESLNKTIVNERLKYTGSGLELALLMYKNLALTILTLGVYAAWGRTNTRRYLWGNVSFMGDRGAYTGTGKELFRGWALLAGIYLVAVIALNMVTAFLPESIQPILGVLIVPIYVYLYALVIYGGTRYRLSRTKWRETHFSMQRDKKSTREFIWLVSKGFIFSILTLGLYLPFFQNAKRRFLINKASFGDMSFHFFGSDSEYFWLVLKNVFLTIITLGFYGSWMMINLLRYKLENISLGDSVRLRIDLKGSEIFVFSLLAYFSTILTLGLAIPWVVNKSYHMFINAVEVYGEIDFQSIHNVESEGNAIADVASVEYDFDLGF